MALKFAGTMNAINRGLEGLKPAQAVHIIEDWEAALAETDVSGSKGIARDLAALRTQLEKPEPNSIRVLTLLFRLGEATVKIAARAEKNQDKISSLGEALHEAGDEDADEAEDTEAAAAPKRRGSRPAKTKK